MQTQRQNPYVGPGALTSGDPIFGRDRELAELVDLVIAERIVLLLSPSGAGKTSLLEAKTGLRKRLGDEAFRVLPSIRVSTPLSEASIEKQNRYIESVARSLGGDPVADAAGEGGPIDLRKTLDRAGHSDTDRRPIVLIFDQFEELLTLDPADQAAKTEFMQQLGAALHNRERWAVFAMREEFVSALDPYARSIPTRLVNRYRIDLLGPAAATEAIIEPAATEQVEFAADAASALVDDLRRITVQGADGIMHEALGPHVEPVQLQVVCRRLWTKIPPESNRIDSAKELVGNAEEALTGYYDDTIAEIAAQTGVKEALLRNWFEHELITTRGLRTQVAEYAEETQAIRAAIPALETAHLVRREARRGGTWYELAHDRLVRPVRISNERWLKANQSGWDVQAASWERSGRLPHMLPEEEDVRKLEQWLDEDEDRATLLLQSFATEARRKILAEQTRRVELQRKEAAASTRQAQRVKAFATGVSIVALFLIGLAWYSWRVTHRLAEQTAALMKTRTELGETQRDKTKLEQTVDTVGREVQQEYQPSGPPPNVPTASPAQSLRADIALRRVVSVEGPQGSGRWTIQYFARDFDDSKVTQALQTLGFRIDRRPRQLDAKYTNAIWYGSEVDVQDVKILALALLRAGIGLQLIKPLNNSAGRESVIQIGNKAIETSAILTVEDIERLSPEVREVYAHEATVGTK